jgi:hypothetical protein
MIFFRTDPEHAAASFLRRFAPDHWNLDEMAGAIAPVFSGSGSEAAIQAAHDFAFRASLHPEILGTLCFAAHMETIIGRMHRSCFSVLLAQAWMFTEGRFEGRHLNACADLFESAIPHNLMTVEELEVFDALPDEVTVYRGSLTSEGARRVRGGMSWTLSQKVGNWFAQRGMEQKKNHHCRPLLLQGTVRKADVFAYFAGRDEQELVVRPGSVRAVEVMNMKPLRPERDAA